MAHWSLLYCHSLSSILGDVERDFVPSIGFHPEHQVITDHEHQPELGCSGFDHHHQFPSNDSCCIVYAPICDLRETRVFFLLVYLAYKDDGSAKIKNNKQSKIKKISTKL